MLLQKLLAERRNERRLETIRLNTTKPDTKSEQSRKRLLQLRVRTAEIEEELDLRQQVEAEQARFCKAQRALHEKNLTLTERKAQAEETRQFQIRLSRVISPEHHPDWRLHATETFRSRKL